jgi:AcrR family transcriptional regulator
MSETENKIIARAYELFRREGYSNMRITQISTDLNISPGNLTYYFSTKDSLIEYVFKNYLDNIQTWIDNTKLKYEHFFSSSLYKLFIHDINILKDNAARRFYYELLGKPVLNNIMKAYIDYSFRLLYDHHSIRIGPRLHKYYIESNIAMFQVLDKLFIEEDKFSNKDIINHVTLKQQMRAHFWHVYRVMPGEPVSVEGVSKSIISHIKELKKHDFSVIKLLP